MVSKSEAGRDLRARSLRMARRRRRCGAAGRLAAALARAPVAVPAEVPARAEAGRGPRAASSALLAREAGGARARLGARRRRAPRGPAPAVIVSGGHRRALRLVEQRVQPRSARESMRRLPMLDAPLPRAAAAVHLLGLLEAEVVDERRRDVRRRRPPRGSLRPEVAPTAMNGRDWSCAPCAAGPSAGRPSSRKLPWSAVMKTLAFTLAAASMTRPRHASILSMALTAGRACPCGPPCPGWLVHEDEVGPPGGAPRRRRL